MFAYQCAIVAAAGVPGSLYSRPYSASMTAATPLLPRDLNAQICAWRRRYPGYEVWVGLDDERHEYAAEIRFPGLQYFCLTATDASSAKAAWGAVLAEFERARAMRCSVTLQQWNARHADYVAEWTGAHNSGTEQKAEIVVRRAADMTPVVRLSTMTPHETMLMLARLQL